MASSKSMPLAAAISIAALSVVVCGVGVLAMVSGYAPERSTKFGMSSALYGPEAMHLGSSIVVLGLLPLIVFARGPRTAAWLGSGLAFALLANVFFGARIWI